MPALAKGGALGHSVAMRRFIYDEPVTGYAVWSRRVALLAAVVAGYAVIMLRAGAQDWRGAATVGAALALCAFAGLLALVAFIRIWRLGRQGAGIAAQAVALVLVLLALPGFYAARALTLPMINDVSTDIASPPDFSRSRAGACGAGRARAAQSAAGRTRAPECRLSGHCADPARARCR